MSVGLLVVGAPRSAASDVEVLLSRLPALLPVPVVLVQHRGPLDALAAPLGRRCPLSVVEPDDKDDLVPGRVHLAPAGYHLLVDRGTVCLSVEPPEHGCRPSIDALFDSTADSHGASAAALLFAGHEDGLAGLGRLRSRGGRVAVVGEAEEAGVGPEVERLSLADVDGWLSRWVHLPRGRVSP
ncbi:chemotaxis protein CheB [Myxococcus sp. K15C18031901]|uniref:chemotaxis protein CheB n=1 Tax=Myxococcus dinghuensis TaxID=2906761 RepID=UPI0020A7A853|nr:chemotaxis protein CheB [Myxococcus dinghuensis]MCP3100931.1 chemotaxis protein CheB [Myxococcus dinghuensis]